MKDLIFTLTSVSAVVSGALAISPAQHASLKARGAFACSPSDSRVQALNKAVSDPVTFCKWWKTNKDTSSETPFTTVVHSDIDKVCGCVVTKTAVVTKKNVALKEAAPLVKIASDLTKPADFCKYWVKIAASNKKTSPFTNLQPADVTSVCVAINKNPKVLSSTTTTTTTTKAAAKTSAPVTTPKTSAPAATSKAPAPATTPKTSARVTSAAAAAPTTKAVTTSAAAAVPVATTTTTAAPAAADTAAATLGDSAASNTETAATSASTEAAGQLVDNSDFTGTGSDYLSESDLSLPSWKWSAPAVQAQTPSGVYLSTFHLSSENSNVNIVSVSQTVDGFVPGQGYTMTFNRKRLCNSDYCEWSVYVDGNLFYIDNYIVNDGNKLAESDFSEVTLPVNATKSAVELKFQTRAVSPLFSQDGAEATVSGLWLGEVTIE